MQRLSPTFPQIQQLYTSMKSHLADNKCGERLRTGVKVALTGPPDVGKSSLLNYLCGEDRAIVAAGPGTTRDVLTVDVSLDGYPVVFIDTAGLRFGDHVGEVEREASDYLLLLFCYASPDHCKCFIYKNRVFDGVRLQHKRQMFESASKMLAAQKKRFVLQSPTHRSPNRVFAETSLIIKLFCLLSTKSMLLISKC